jgi:prepilin-type N-terminal cleavage/methylation domain-containing protein
MTRGNEAGYSLIETLVAISVFAVLSTSLYLVLFQVTRGSTKARDIAKISQEARLGFTRLVRDTRQGFVVMAGDGNSYTVSVDFDGDGAIDTSGPNSQGDYEVLTYSFRESDGTVRINGEVLMRAVDCLRRPNGTCYPAFDYGSGRLEYDWNRDGVTSWQELDGAPSHGVVGVGNNNNVLDDGELPDVSQVSIALRLEGETDTTDFSSVAQLRNQR